MDVKFCLVFPREALSVPVMRHVLGDTLRSLGADDDGVADLLLAVTEACTNVVRHGGPGRRYEVVASVGRAGCRVEVLNSGRGFDPVRLPGLRAVWSSVPAAARIRRRVARPAPFGRSHRAASAPRSDDAIAALPESGRGLAIMKACVDDVTLSCWPADRARWCRCASGSPGGATRCWPTCRTSSCGTPGRGAHRRRWSR